MKISIIGAGGFVGKHCVAHLSQKHEVIAIGRTKVNLLDSSAAHDLAALIAGSDAVVILAAITPKKGSTASQIQQRFIDNLTMAHAVNLALSQTNIPNVIYISSDAVYADSAVPLTEASITNPAGLYGLAHLARERMLLEMQQQTNVCILRPCAILGAGDPHNAYGPNTFVREALNKQTISLFGAGEELRNYIYIEDLVNIIKEVIERKITGIYNVAAEPACSFNEIARLICAINIADITIKQQPRVMPIVHKTHETSKLRQCLPELQFTSMLESLKQLYTDIKLTTATI